MLSEVIGRGDLEEQEPHRPKSINNGIDCSSVITSWAKHAEGNQSSFPYRGFFRTVGLQGGSPLQGRCTQARVPGRPRRTADGLEEQRHGRLAGEGSQSQMAGQPVEVDQGQAEEDEALDPAPREHGPAGCPMEHHVP